MPGRRPPEVRRRRSAGLPARLRRPCRHVHLKDVDPDVLARAQAEEWSFGDALRAIIFPELGDGMVPIPQIVADLQDRGYDGWYVLEQDTTHKHPKDAAAINLRYVQSLGL